MQSAVVGVVRAASRYRWTVCALLFFATVINYMDRQILGLLAPCFSTTSAGARCSTAAS